jgi:hypothetical protein
MGLDMTNRQAHIGRAMLKAITRTYIRKIRPRAQAEIDWFAHQPSLDAAIEKAALAVNSRGKRYSHQRRLTREALKEALGNLLEKADAMEQARDFDALFGLVGAAVKPIHGLGELYVYDTSLRIGAKLNMFPTRVYLHAGTRLGASALGLDGSAATLKLSDLPSEFRTLEPHEVEDVLCIYKDELKTTSAETKPRDSAKWSWCH